MILDTASKTIEVILPGAVTTNQLEITADWVDTKNGLTFAPGGTSLVTNGGTAVTVVPSPAASTQRQVKALTIYNADTVNQTVTVRMFDGTNRRRHITATLLPGASLVFTPEGGWSTPSGTPFQSFGTWTPSDQSGAGLTLAVTDAEFVQQGLIVIASFRFAFPATASGAANSIGGLPFTSANRQARISSFVLNTGGLNLGTFINLNATTFGIYQQGGFSLALNSALSSVQMIGAVQYTTA